MSYSPAPYLAGDAYYHLVSVVGQNLSSSVQKTVHKETFGTRRDAEAKAKELARQVPGARIYVARVVSGYLFEQPRPPTVQEKFYDGDEAGDFDEDDEGDED